MKAHAFCGLAALAVLAACGEPITPVTLCSGDPAAISIVGGDSQLTQPGLALPLPLTALVTDSGGQPHVGAVVVFSVVSGAGSLAPDSAVTGFDGRASTRYTPDANSAIDTQRVRAVVRSRCAPGGAPPLAALFGVLLQNLTHPAGVVAASPPLGQRPFGIAISGSGVVLVTRLDSAAVTRASASAMTLGATVAVGSTPTAVAFSPDGKTAYVANQLSSNVGFVDVASNTQVAVTPVGGNTFNVIASPNGARVYTTTNTNWVYAIDASSRAVMDSVAVGDAPSAMVFGSGDTLLYVSSFFGGTVAEISVKGAMAVTRTFTLGGSPQGIVRSTDGTKLFVANEAGRLNVVDIASGTVTAPVSLAVGAFGLAMTPDRLQLYATGGAAGVVQVVDLASMSVTKTIPTGGQPMRIAFSPDGLTAAVANQSGSVIFIR